jgi:cell division protease FtsH
MRKTADVSSGAAMDIQTATQCARQMVLEWGMSDRLGFVNYSGADTRESFIPEREYSEETARIIDEEVRRLIDEAYADAERMLSEHWDKVEAVAQALLKYETLQSDDVDCIMRGQRLDKPTVADLLREEAARTGSARPGPARRPQRDVGGEPNEGMMPSPA